jgi:SAM-dependent MidA family methyltransferase
MSAAVAAVIAAAIDRHGPLPFDRFMELALYHDPLGFYTDGGMAGRRGDFITSPEVGPLFGAVMARALDQWWDELGQPPVFVVMECGAGPGTLAAAILAASPRCAPYLRYVLIERSPVQRAEQQRRLPLEPPANAFPLAHGDDETPDVVGPVVIALAELPEVEVDGVILANELLDNLPFAICERGVHGWSEVLVANGENGFVEVLVPAPDGYRELAEALAARAVVGERIPIQVGAWRWLAAARPRLRAGRIVCVDYARWTAEMAADARWLRTYRQHELGVGALEAPGTQDITADVALDQLARVAAPTSVQSQAEFLTTYGIEELVAEGRRVWGERAAIGDLAALRARSRISESEALLDPAGLGGFTVMHWTLGGRSRVAVHRD